MKAVSSLSYSSDLELWLRSVEVEEGGIGHARHLHCVCNICE
jgi:hypothetical protein